MDVFATLAEPTRRRIVELLADGERSVGELCCEFSISQPAVSRHLRVLRQARLVSSRTDAQRRLYSLRPGPLEEIDNWRERYRSFWDERLDQLGDLLTQQQETKDDEQAKERKKR